MERKSTPSELTTQILILCGVSLFLVAIGVLSIHTGITVAVVIWIVAAVIAGYAAYIARCISNEQLVVIQGEVIEVAAVVHRSKVKRIVYALFTSLQISAVKYIVLLDTAGRYVRINTRKRLNFMPREGDTVCVYLLPSTQIYKTDDTYIPGHYLVVKRALDNSSKRR